MAGEATPQPQQQPQPAPSSPGASAAVVFGALSLLFAVGLVVTSLPYSGARRG